MIVETLSHFIAHKTNFLRHLFNCFSVSTIVVTRDLYLAKGYKINNLLQFLFKYPNYSYFLLYKSV